MNKRSYYVVLGVSRTENASGIRAAYRDLAKRLHPDVAGADAAPAFRELTEAYEVLSDPSRRDEYNDQLRQVDQKDRGHLDLRGIRSRPRKHTSFAPFEVQEGTSPSFDALRERLLRNFTGVGIPKSEQLEALNFEALLTREEARHGCVVPIEVPAFRRCPECRGSGLDWLSPCTRCGQRGLIGSQRRVELSIPPGVESGASYDLLLDTLGVRNLYLRVHVFVQSGSSIA